MARYFIRNKRALMRKWYKHAYDDSKLSKVSAYAHYHQAQNCFVHIRREVDSVLESFYIDNKES